MKLRLKLFTLFSVTYLLIFGVIQLASNSVLLGGMEELENMEITGETATGVESMKQMISDIDGATMRLSSYDNVFRFTKAPDLVSEEYVWRVVNDAALSEADINYLFIFDLNGESVLERGYDQGTNTLVPQELVNFFEMNSILVVHQKVDSKLSGLLKTPAGLCVASSQPISSGEENIVGSMIVCRMIDTDEGNADAPSMNVDLIPLIEEKQSAYIENIISRITTEEPILVEKLDEETMKGYSVVNDLYGNPAILVIAEAPRLIYGMGVKMVNYFVLSFVLIGISIGMLALLALNRLVVMPLSKLSKEVAEINPQTINETTVAFQGDDEIARLSQDIEEMLKTLREYQNRIKETERMVSIGATATMVGHDLRNPLQVVVMLTDLIKKKINRLSEDELDEQHQEIQRLTHRIKEQAVYMNKIVSDLQGLTKGLSLEVEDVYLVDLIEDIIESVQMPETILPKVYFEDDFPEIFADRAKLQRVFTNLITNAVQAMRSGGELVVRGHSDDEKVYVSVIDTGCGISDSNLDKIFDPLFTTKAKGTGLGLTVCKRIVEAHGGEIVVKSHIDVGTRFTIGLPIKNESKSYDQIAVGFDYANISEHILPSCL
ncbi:MAG: ATP-binding protein [Candidatus Bathyarchaeota archaeon]|nr:ATP-binding protein [Candidatus Bathyarchaeota archaeon]